jgi:hypothetical protein
MRVKIIDEHNRVPTRTPSALLTLMADNYAEMLDQVIDCPKAAWYLTANDDIGGGTYQVIEALRYQQSDGVDATKAWQRVAQLLRRFGDSGGGPCRSATHNARMRLLRALCSTSASPRRSSTGGM